MSALSIAPLSVPAIDKGTRLNIRISNEFREEVLNITIGNRLSESAWYCLSESASFGCTKLTGVCIEKPLAAGTEIIIKGDGHKVQFKGVILGIIQ